MTGPGTGPSGQDQLPDQGRLLAVDLGDVRIGLAVSDPSQTIASPAETVPVPQPKRRRRSGAAAEPPPDVPTIDAVVAAVARYDVAGIVIGDPRRLDGREGEPSRRARRVAEQVRERTGLPVRLVDERFSTVEAERVMLDQDASRAERRASIDRVAAGVLLQTVLESKRRGHAG